MSKTTVLSTKVDAVLYRQACLMGVVLIYDCITRTLNWLLSAFKTKVWIGARTWLFPTQYDFEYQACIEETGKLATIWDTEDPTTVLFIALDVSFQDENEKNVKEIGLSHWFLGGASDIESFHWKIQSQRELSSAQFTTDDNTFPDGGTEYVSKDGIALSLSRRLDPLLSQSTHVNIIGYDLATKMGALQRYWQVPVAIETLDIHKICKVRLGVTESRSLEECLNIMNDLGETSTVLENAGVRARAVMRLLQVEGPTLIELESE